MRSHRNELQCTVTSAAPLDKTTLEQLAKSLKGFAGQGENLKIGTKVDPKIIGGLIVEVGDKFVDMSIASRVKTLTQQLLQPM